MDEFRSPVTLAGRRVRLEPLLLDHAPALRTAARNPEAYRFMFGGPGTTESDLRSFISTVLAAQSSGTDLAFTTVVAGTGRPVGMTRFLHIDRENRSVEVGGTWLAPELWRTPVNTEAKYLMFRHAFETEGFHRVSLQTDLRNERAQRSIAGLGAVKEAVFRDDKLLRDGSYRTSVFYGIVAAEWPTVKRNLEQKLERPWTAPAEPRSPEGGRS